MYLASIIAEKQLFCYLSSWYNEASESESYDLETMLNRATSAVLALDSMTFHEKVCLESYAFHLKSLDIKKERISFSCPDLFQLVHQFTPFLSALKFMQDMIIPMVVRKLELKISVPMSLSKSYPKLDTYGLPSEINELIKEYWEKSGSNLRAYRILDQHYFPIFRHIYLDTRNKAELIICLPDDPTIQNEKKVTFEKNLNAIPIFIDAFNHIHECIEMVAKCLGFKPSILQQKIIFGDDLGKTQDNIEQTMSLFVEDSNTYNAIEVAQTKTRRLKIRRLQGIEQGSAHQSTTAP